jgi:hypothetical protein
LSAAFKQVFNRFKCKKVERVRRDVALSVVAKLQQLGSGAYILTPTNEAAETSCNTSSDDPEAGMVTTLTFETFVELVRQGLTEGAAALREEDRDGGDVLGRLAPRTRSSIESEGPAQVYMEVYMEVYMGSTWGVHGGCTWGVHGGCTGVQVPKPSLNPKP